MIAHRSVYNDLRRNEVGLNCVMSRRFLGGSGCRLASAWVLCRVKGGWARVRSDFLRIFILLTGCRLCVSWKKSSCDTCCDLMGLVWTEFVHIVHDDSDDTTLEVFAFIGNVITLWRETIKQHLEGRWCIFWVCYFGFLENVLRRFGVFFRVRGL